VITVVVTKPISEVTDVMTEPINAAKAIPLELCDEGSVSGLFGEGVETLPTWKPQIKQGIFFWPYSSYYQIMGFS
jgi:hypothetical protein